MRLTEKNLLIETTNTIHGCLEQGGVCRRIEAYPLADAMRVTGMSKEQLSRARGSDICPGYAYRTLKDALEGHIKPRIIRRGEKIQ